MSLAALKPLTASQVTRDMIRISGVRAATLVDRSMVVMLGHHGDWRARLVANGAVWHEAKHLPASIGRPKRDKGVFTRHRPDCVDPKPGSRLCDCSRNNWWVTLRSDLRDPHNRYLKASPLRNEPWWRDRLAELSKTRLALNVTVVRYNLYPGVA